MSTMESPDVQINMEVSGGKTTTVVQETKRLLEKAGIDAPDNRVFVPAGLGSVVQVRVPEGEANTFRQSLLDTLKEEIVLD